MVDNPQGIAAAEMLTRAISSLDRDTFADVYSDDARVWHNTTNAIQTKTENADLLGAIFELVSELYYHDIKRLPTPEGFVQRHTVKGSFKDGGPTPDLHACIVAKVADGKIVELNEYLDASQFQAVWDRLSGASLVAA